jgi:gas vesicle protein
VTVLALEPTVQVALVTTGGTIVVALIGTALEVLRRHGKAIEQVAEDAAQAREQVTNTHSTNLRDDMDRIHDDVREVLKVLARHGEEISGIREEIRQERRERLAVSERLDDHISAVA